MPFEPCASTSTPSADCSRYRSSWRASGSSSMMSAVIAKAVASCQQYGEAGHPAVPDRTTFFDYCIRSAGSLSGLDLSWRVRQEAPQPPHLDPWSANLRIAVGAQPRRLPVVGHVMAALRAKRVRDLHPAEALPTHIRNLEPALRTEVHD